MCSEEDNDKSDHNVNFTYDFGIEIDLVNIEKQKKVKMSNEVSRWIGEGAHYPKLMFLIILTRFLTKIMQKKFLNGKMQISNFLNLQNILSDICSHKIIPNSINLVENFQKNHMSDPEYNKIFEEIFSTSNETDLVAYFFNLQLTKSEINEFSCQIIRGFYISSLALMNKISDEVISKNCWLQMNPGCK